METMTALLNSTEVARAAAELPDWKLENSSLTRTVTCETFPSAIAFVGRIADVAERMGHHPDIDIRWRDVRLTLSTHSAGGLTALDAALAHQIDELVG